MPNLDLSKLTVKLYRGIYDGVDGEMAAIVAVTGKTQEEVENMPWNEYRALLRDIVNAAREPLDPN